MTFNLIVEPWIPVLRSNGKFERVGIRCALTEAGTIRQIAASNPMDAFAVHRFLLTLFYWKADAAEGVDEVRKKLLQGMVPGTIIQALQSESSHLDLFDAIQPFLQDVPEEETKAKKSAGSLFAEMACGTNIAFFHHGDDRALRLCRPCATIGLLRLVPWSQSGGAGLSPAVHNAPPIMALACGANLAETLGLNLVPLTCKAGTARWSGHFQPSTRDSAIPYLEALTWNPRLVYLGHPSVGGTCWRCGQSGVPVIGPIVYAKNEKTKLEKRGEKTVPFQWRDPAAFYRADSEYTTIKSYDEAEATCGRDLLGLTIENPPASLVVQSNPDHHNWLLIVPCTNPANNKSYDQRQTRRTTLAPDQLRASIPPKAPPARQAAVDGWDDPYGRPQRGVFAFLRAATRLLKFGDWATLRNAEYRRMDESPEAFDLLAGLYWPLRRRVSGLPSRNVAWLVLKLMATVQATARKVGEGGVCPLRALSKRQIDERRGNHGTRSPYPRMLPRGIQLEAALRHSLAVQMRKRSTTPIDWAVLCHHLDELLN